MSTPFYISKAKAEEWKYPQIAATAEGHLQVSSDPLHKIYYHEYGNLTGEPVFFLHGGPGGGTIPQHAQFFDPVRYRIVLFDQRGAGKSLPSVSVDPVAGLSHNTTAHLISDINALRDHLGVKGKMHVFGGSWGSTLALAYAIAHSENVMTLALRGIFLVRKVDIDYFYQGNAANYHNKPFDVTLSGAYQMFPEAWKAYVEVIPTEKRADMVKAYSEVFKLTPSNDEERAYQDSAARAWSIWEGVTSYLGQDVSDLGKFADTDFAKTFAKVENHYFMSGGFLGPNPQRDNNYLLENVAAIKDITIKIVHGRYDCVCPRFMADELVAALKAAGAKDVEYTVTVAGHSMSERENMLELTRFMDTMPKIC